MSATGAKGRQTWAPSGWSGELDAGDRRGVDADGAAEAVEVGDGALVDVDGEGGAVPVHAARADLEGGGRLAQGGFAAVGHRPAAAAAVEGDVDAAVVGRVAAAAPAVPGREHRADEADDRDGMVAVAGDAVDVPPGVAVGRDGQVEARSARIAAAACRPESAAIGMPGPGCDPAARQVEARQGRARPGPAEGGHQAVRAPAVERALRAGEERREVVRAWSASRGPAGARRSGPSCRGWRRSVSGIGRTPWRRARRRALRAGC